MKRNLAYYLFVLLLLGNSACLELVIVEIEAEDQRLVVEGQFTLDTQRPHQLRLYLTSSLGINIGEPVEGAEVYLNDSDGKREAYADMGEGYYHFFNNEIKAEAGKSYFIDFSLRDGRSYRSTPQIMPQAVEGDSISLVFENRTIVNEVGNFLNKPVFDILVHTKVSNAGETQWLRWFVDEIYSFPEVDSGFPLDIPLTCYFRTLTEPQRNPLFTNDGSGIDRIDNFEIATKNISTVNDREFRGKHYFNAYQYAISQEAFDYWSKVEKIANQQGNIFDPIPATVRGNVVNQNDEAEIVLGFFELAAADTMRVSVIPSKVQDYVTIPNMCPKPGLPFSGQVPRACWFCTTLDGFSLERPPWF